MTETQIRYIELFITAIKTSSFYDDDDEFDHNPAIYIDYLSLHEAPEDHVKKFRTELDGISRQKFRDEYSIEELSKAQERKVKALYNTIERLETKRKKPVPHAVINGDDALSKVYSFYASQRAHKVGSDVILIEISEGKALEISKMLQVIAKEYLLLSLIDEIQTHLEFNEIYSTNDLQIVDTAAEACHRIRKQLVSTGQTITKEQLIQKVLDEFHIKRYTDQSSQDTKSLVKKAVGQWIRDNKVDCITN